MNVFAADPPDSIDALLARYQELGLFNGSALVADRGQVVMKKGYGLANMEWGIPNTPDTKFALGSISKQFTATLIMQLVEQGKIDLACASHALPSGLSPSHRRPDHHPPPPESHVRNRGLH